MMANLINLYNPFEIDDVLEIIYMIYLWRKSQSYNSITQNLKLNTIKHIVMLGWTVNQYKSK